MKFYHLISLKFPCIFDFLDSFLVLYQVSLKKKEISFKVEAWVRGRDIHASVIQISSDFLWNGTEMRGLWAVCALGEH